MAAPASTLTNYVNLIVLLWYFCVHEIVDVEGIHGCAAIKNKCAPIWKSGEKMVICEFKLSCQLFHWWLLLLLSPTSFSVNFITNCHFCWTKITKQQLLYMIEEKQLEVEGEAMVCLCSLSGGKKSLNHCVNTSYVLVQLMLDLNLKFMDLPSP